MKLKYLMLSVMAVSINLLAQENSTTVIRDNFDACLNYSGLEKNLTVGQKDTLRGALVNKTFRSYDELGDTIENTLDSVDSNYHGSNLFNCLTHPNVLERFIESQRKPVYSQWYSPGM